MSAVLAERIDQYEVSRVSALKDLAEALRSFSDDSSRSAFAQLFTQAQALLELSDSDVAREIKVSRPTVGRWARGVASPHRIIRESAFRVLADMAEAKLKLKLKGHRS